MKTPYLIQRGEINRPLSDFRGQRLSRAVDLDYMGSAEFEFGALPKSQRALGESPVTKVRTVREITEDGVALKTFSALTDEEHALYVGFLLRMRNEREGKLHTKETTGFDPTHKYGKNDFWWDVENHVMWSFDKAFMNHLPDNVKASVTYMNEQRALKA